MTVFRRLLLSFVLVAAGGARVGDGGDSPPPSVS